MDGRRTNDRKGRGGAFAATERQKNDRNPQMTARHRYGTSNGMKTGFRKASTGTELAEEDGETTYLRPGKIAATDV